MTAVRWHCALYVEDAEKKGRSMMMCCNCMNAWFCGQECLKKNYKSIHREECKLVSKEVKTLAKDMRSVYSRPHYMPLLYYFGNTPAVDLINISMNEGQEYSDPLRLLLCGVGDPRNVCLTISKLHTTHNGVDFVLNDISDCTLARTVLLLYMLWKGKFSYYQFFCVLSLSVIIAWHSSISFITCS